MVGTARSISGNCAPPGETARISPFAAEASASVPLLPALAASLPVLSAAVLSALSAALLSALLSVPVVVSATALLSALAALSLAASLLLPVLPCEQAVSIAAANISASACFFEILRLMSCPRLYV